MAADDTALDDHLRGKHPIKGIYRHDEPTIEELERRTDAAVEARLAERIANRRRKRDEEKSGLQFAA
jgi:hypothetical protein